jgi:2-polyprenyl-3-methyl-5-hydroxy-6-metoxy-1,4-benzoquinol methylase
LNRRAYDLLADQYAERIDEDEAGDTTLMQPFFELLEQRFGQANKLRLLDVGCGGGLNLRMMCQHGTTPPALIFRRKCLGLLVGRRQTRN